MKKRIFTTLMTITLVAGLLTGCGATEQPAETAETTETVNETVETPELTESAAEPTEAPTPEPTEEPTPKPTEGPVADFTRDIAMEKVVNLFNARNELFKNGKVDTDLNFLVAAETLTGGIRPTELKTADNFNPEDDLRVLWVIITNYFYDYTNNDCGYYDLGEYFTSHTYDEIMNKYSSNLVGDGDWLTNESTMLEVVGVLPYLLANMDNMTFGELITCDENCKINPISGVEVCYEMPLLINEEKCGVTAVFDELGNLLNLITVDEDGWSDDNYGDSTAEVLALE